ncbi:hypothetical protein GGR58DRAFT_501346 [Xylaria digitata]|nr:hypothetical protein GGR58DRAFT_501346 [Xylaria digitata]
MSNSSGIGRLQAALASVTNEVTVAAANLNFDFSLVKCEAPREYQSIGQSLTPYRKTEAEAGSQHITARRLGALFEGVCPKVPNLISVFGKRATEISQDAAATSSKAALPVYLLACMLARAWDDADATSLWVEIVAERRRAIATSYHNEEPIPFATAAAAAQAEITRDQLAKWDASARAWLRTADATMFRQRKQFLLIANNIDIPINNETQTYDSIVVAWTTALEAMDKLIGGQPLAVKNGAVLLAISAWHIYPDMVVFSGKDSGKSIDMKDPLVHQAGVISLGLSDSSFRASQGVYWSLALAKHKFYGRAIRKTSQLNGDGSRLTFPELQMVVIGVILSKWEILPSGTFAALEFLQNVFSPVSYDSLVDTHGWIRMILDPVARFFQDEAVARPLLSLGRRRDGFFPSLERDEFLPSLKSDRLFSSLELARDELFASLKRGPEQSLFGLTHLKTILEIIETPNNRVDLLRRLAFKVENMKNFEVYIRYKDVNGDWYLATVFEVVPTTHGKLMFGNQTKPRRSRRGRRREKCHCRWIDDSSAIINASPTEISRSVTSLPLEGGTTTITTLHPSWTLSFLFGDADSAAIFMLAGAPETVRQTLVPSIGYADILWCLEHQILSPARVLSFLSSQESAIIKCLKILKLMSEIYIPLTLQGATISPRILTAPIPWQLTTDTIMRTRVSPTANPMHDYSRFQSLAVIAYFETGFWVEMQNKLDEDEILGISAGDSIFVPSKLLHDPCAHFPSYQFSRLLGNVARPGVTILTSPKQPEAREIDLNGFRTAITEFNGERIDCFQSTSLHLSFTEWSVPLYSRSTIGQRDSEAVHAEAVVSVRDSGIWVADINILAAFAHADVQELPTPSVPCGHPQPSKPPKGAVSIETWDQILDCPAGLVVTRSFKNWVARMAIVAVLAQHCRLKSKRIYICPENMCWGCLPNLENNVIYVY